MVLAMDRQQMRTPGSPLMLMITMHIKLQPFTVLPGQTVGTKLPFATVTVFVTASYGAMLLTMAVHSVCSHMVRLISLKPY